MTLREVFDALLDRHGPQGWWPGETPFEVMVGAVLTQNTAWSNVARAIANLTREGCLEPEAIVTLPEERLAALLRPSGYFNVKARRLRGYCLWYLAEGGFEPLERLDTPLLRRKLLQVSGIGPETADDILLYAFRRPVFVIDAYTRRLLLRLGRIDGNEPYEDLRALFEEALCSEPDRVALFNEFHALIVAHAKAMCRKQTPLCDRCPLQRFCRTKAGDIPLISKS